MLGYKIASNNGTRVLVTLSIPCNAKSNLNRDGIVDKEYAKYRCDRATVVSIKDEKGNKYNTALSLIYKGKTIEYKVGEEITESNYDKHVNIVCGEGIHFFLNKEIALLYGLDKIENGEFKKWHDNGQLRVQTTYVDSKLHGEYKEWFDNSKLNKQTTYVDGKIYGDYKIWHNNGHLYIQTTYVDGKFHGVDKMWHNNGHLYIQTTYVDGKKNGEYKRWDRDGNLIEDMVYIEGVEQTK